MNESLTLEMVAYLAAAVISVPIFHRLGLGSILGYLCAGVAIGPFGLRFAGGLSSDVMSASEIGIVMMLFLVGLELEAKTLWRMRNAIVGMGGAQVGLSAVVIMLGCCALGLSWAPALGCGLILAMSSTAIVLPSLQERNALKTPGGQASLAVLLLQDLAVIPVIALLPILAGVVHPHATIPAEHPAGEQSYVLHTGVIIAAVVGIILAGRFFVRPFFRFIAVTHLQEIFTASALLIVVGIVILMDRVGLDSALGAFLGGMVLADSEFKHQIEADIAPFKGLLLGLFFVAVGAGINFSDLITHPTFIVALIVGLVVLKFAVLYGVGRLFKLSKSSSFLFAFALAQGDEFAFVLLPTSHRLGLLDDDWSNALMLTTAMSMVITPFLLMFNEALVQPRFATKDKPKRKADVVHQPADVLLVGFGRFGNVVGRFLRATGVPITVLDHDADQIDTVRRLGLEAFFGDGTRLDILRAAGAEEAKLVLVMIDEQEASMKIVEHFQKHFPNAKILARAVDRQHAYELIQKKVTGFTHESIGSAIHLTRLAFQEMGVGPEKADRLGHMFEELEYRAMRDLATTPRGDGYFRRARQHIDNLEKALRSSIDLSKVE